MAAKEADKGAQAASLSPQGNSAPTYNFYKPKNVIIGDVSGADSGIQNLCPERMRVAMLKDILYHCPRRKEAMYTLEDKLCTKLSEVWGKRVVSFQEHFQITFRDFLEKHSEHFRVSQLDNDLIVSRVIDSPHGDVRGGSSTLQDTNSPSNPWNRTQQEREEHTAREPKQTEQNVSSPDRYFRAKVPCNKRQQHDRPESILRDKTPIPESKEDFLPREGQVAAASGPEGQAEVKDTSPERVTRAPEPEHGPASKNPGRVMDTAGCLPEASGNDHESCLVTNCLWRKPSDTLMFKVSDEAYADPVKLTIDIVSLWNTPDRDCGHILLGVKPLVSLPHQVVGLKSARKAEFYTKTFLWNLFDFQPKFTYRETVWDNKVVGLLNVQKSAGHCSPSIVRSNEKTPHLTKNQLWFRKEGKNVAVSGSDMSREDVRRIYSWFLMEGNPPSSRGMLGDGQSREQMVITGTRSTGPPSRIAAGQKQGSEHESDSVSLLPSLNPENEIPPSAASKPDVHPPEGRSSSNSEAKHPSELMEALNYFKKGHFILLCGTLSHTVPDLDALSLAPWIAVYDFDVCGRETGLLAYLEQNLQQRRNINVFTWMDPHSAVTERGTQWWSLRGRLEIPESNLSELSPMKWLQKVCDKLEKLCTELARLSQDYTVLSILVLWPTSREEMKCMQKFLNELQKRIRAQPSIYLCFTGAEVEKNALEVQNIVEDAEENVRKVEVNLAEFCSEVLSVFSGVNSGVFKYQLPGGTTSVDVEVKVAAWLRQDLEVLYLQNPYTPEEMSLEDLQAEGSNFFRGGSLSWLARYDMGTACFDVERCRSREITKHILEQHVQRFNGGIIRLLHAPGAGGSTMAQRVLFDLHDKTPCLHIKQSAGSAVEEVVERLRYLADHTQMPVVALMDGVDEQKLQLLYNQLRCCRTIFLHVKRYPHFIDRKHLFQQHRNIFFVLGFVTKKESRNLALQYQNHCCDNEYKKRALHALDQEVQKDRQAHQMFEYGLTVFDHQFQGVQAYVKGYLQMADCGDYEQVQPWQRSVGYLALVYYYAQVSLPCYFIGSIIGSSTDPIVDIEDLPFFVRMLVVRDMNEGKRNYVRIMHYMVALEILEQILNPRGPRSGSENLSEGAKSNLKNFCLDFLEAVVKDGDCASFVLLSVLTKTFILRPDDLDMEEAADCESRTKRKFSAILLDMDSSAPYPGRLQVLQKLCQICPEDANMRAHLGRFYSLCRPHEEEKAEQNFKEAVRMAAGSELQHKNDLAYIYHMYGCFLRKKMNRKISASASVGDVIEDAEQACQKFSSCRYSAPPATRNVFWYFCEIDVRLQVCRLVGQSFPGGLRVLLQPQQEAVVEFSFVKGSIIEVQDLFTLCNNTLVLDDASMAELQRRISKFNTIFRGVAKELQALAEDDPLTSLRLKVTAKKLQHASGSNVVFMENLGMPREVMVYVVEALEQIFKYDTFHQVQKDKLELDYRDWILAVRHPHFPQSYMVERVLEDVRRWRLAVEGVQSLAVFYQFVLLSLLGMGTSASAGLEECLEEAVRLKAAVQRQGRADSKARQPREWLGKGEDASGIKRLVSQGYVPLNQHRVTATAQGLLAVCKGTVDRRPKESRGFIIMEKPWAPKQRGNKQSIRVFFVPAHTDRTALLHKGARVQFYLAFTQENGYEAYDVLPLERSQCCSCGLWVEITRDKRSVTCPGQTGPGRPCNTVIERKDRWGGV